jgi:hypothetical protein
VIFMAQPAKRDEYATSVGLSTRLRSYVLRWPFEINDSRLIPSPAVKFEWIAKCMSSETRVII